MRTAAQIARYGLRDVIRGRWILVYGAALFGLAQALLVLEGDVGRAAAGLVNPVLLITPLVGLLFGTLYLYGARDFIRMLLAQPVGRCALFCGLFAGLALPLLAVECLGLGAPLALAALRRGSAAGIGTLILVTSALTLSSLAIAVLVAVAIRDRAAGMGVAILAWLGLTVLYDGLFATAALTLPGRVLEMPALVATLLNPIDTARILLLMQFDQSALLGYTGAVFRAFFGGGAGRLVASASMLLWIAVPLVIAALRFRRADL